MRSEFFIFWIPMIVIAFANATFRQLVFIKHMSELRAHQYSTLTLIVLCAIYAWLIFTHLKIQSLGQAFICGGLWVFLTVIFEFTLGLLSGRSMNYLLSDYNLRSGRIWPFFLLWLFILPALNYLVRK
ncbi:MAG: hypothetical protein ACTHNG_03830 [Ginsengibacter sp.]